jgi:hypothetical protein
MGVLSVNCWKLTRGVYPSISEISERLQMYNATMMDKWLVNMRLFRVPQSKDGSAKSVYLIDFGDDIQEDAYIVTLTDQGIASQIQSKKDLDRIIHKQMTSLQLRQTAKVDGMAYMIGKDVGIRLGTLSVGAAVKGYVWMEIEYLPCEDAEVCETLLRDCFTYIVQSVHIANTLFFVPSSSDMRLSRAGQYVELLCKENLL